MAAPKKLGKYQIQSLIGKGSMGVVYKALDPVMDRAVAIKTLRTGLVDEEEKENTVLRFKAEARAYGRLLHPNIVTCFECDESDGLIFIVLEYVEGQSLKQIFDREEPFPLERSRYLLRQLLDALAYSHQRGVIHRDIKPANLLVMEGDRVKVTDFGIARIDTSTLTQTGLVMGSPSYMAPEQFSGGRVDHRADIFAAAVIFYQMLTGKRPFGGGDLGEVLHNVLSVVPPLPSRLNPAVPRALDRVVMQALSKEPAGRYQTAADFAAALTACDFTAAEIDPPTGDENAEATVVATSDDLPATELGSLNIFSSGMDSMPVPAEVAAAVVDNKSEGNKGLIGEGMVEPEWETSAVDKDRPVGIGTVSSDAVSRSPPLFATLKKWWLPASVAASAVIFAVLALVTNRSPSPVPIATEKVTIPESGVNSSPSTQTAVGTVMEGAGAGVTDPIVASFDLTPVKALTQVVPCGKVEARLTGNEVILNGFVGNEEDRTGLANAVTGVVGGRPVRSDISVLMWPYCELLPMISGLVRGQDVAESVSTRRHVTYREGDNLVLDLTTPDFPSYVYVDYFLLDGSVVHLFPNNEQTKNSVEPNQRLRIGDGPKTKRWEVSPPFGEEMITIIASARPLFNEPRVEIEKADNYLRALDTGLREVDASQVLANFTFVQTSAKP